MELSPLPYQTVALTGYTHMVTLDHADVAALGAGTTGTIAIFPSANTFPAGLAVHKVAISVQTAFDASDAAINSLLIEVGDGGDTDRVCAQTELAADGAYVAFFDSPKVPYAYVAADTLDAKFTVAGGGSPLLSEINAGEVRIYLALVDLNELDDI